MIPIKKKNKKQKTRQASGIQEWPGHFKWRKNARIEKGGDFGDDLNLPSESWTVRTGDFYFNGLIIPKKERPRELPTPFCHVKIQGKDSHQRKKERRVSLGSASDSGASWV